MHTLRFLTAGHVDDGKSTLIGRLLVDYEALYEDQIEALRGAAGAGSLEFHLAHVTDGLKAERERGITIDVSYTYFRTDRRRFVVADAPGHVEFTRNMVTAASTCHAMVLMVDATRGPSAQTRRHSAIAALLDLPHVIVVVNKMDRVGFSQRVFDRIAHACAALPHSSRSHVHVLPASALRGDNIRERSPRLSWYEGPTLMDLLHEATVGESGTGVRLPLQHVLHPAESPPAYVGTLLSGNLRVGQTVCIQPSGAQAVVRDLFVHGNPAGEAHAGQAVTVVLEGAPTLTRGDVLSTEAHPPEVRHAMEGVLVWLSPIPLPLPYRCRVRVHTAEVEATVEEVLEVREATTLEHRTATRTVTQNALARVRISLHAPIALDRYRTHPATGTFILIDSSTLDTVAGGVVG